MTEQEARTLAYQIASGLIHVSGNDLNVSIAVATLVLDALEYVKQTETPEIPTQNKPPQSDEEFLNRCGIKGGFDA